MDTSSMSFLTTSTTKFGPRIGKLVLVRPMGKMEIDTPGFLTTTSRGVVPHLSHDRVQSATPIRCLSIPFESFLDQLQPIPTLQTGVHPMHKFFAYDPAKLVLFMTPRDPKDLQEMPPNGNSHITAKCLRGVRKLTKDSWRSYANSCRPDFILALSDIPFTTPPYSQRRLTKSVERSLAWLADILQPPQLESSHILVHMAGGTSQPARSAFSNGLLEILHGKEAEAIKPFKCLSDGVAGYVFNLAPLRRSLAEASPDSTLQTITNALCPLLHSSLGPLPLQKPRFANTTVSPHEILLLVQQIGVDIFDVQWAQRAADVGIALDFAFPVRQVGERGPGKRAGGKLDLGHNLYDARYAEDFGGLADASFGDQPICGCSGCSPKPPSTRIMHSSLDEASGGDAPVQTLSPVSRAYLHHLLHTHEMSAHSILVAHNLYVVEYFFTGLRSLLAPPDDQDVEKRFTEEVEKFLATYNDLEELIRDAESCWKEVDLARGKGRLAREKAKQEIEGSVINAN